MTTSNVANRSGAAEGYWSDGYMVLRGKFSSDVVVEMQQACQLISALH